MKIKLAEITDSVKVRTLDPDRVSALAESIKVQGLLQPLIVERVGNAAYRLVDGAHRLAALIAAGWLEGDVVIQSTSGEGGPQSTLSALVANVNRGDMRPYDIAKSVHDLLSAKIPASRIATALGVSPGYISQLKTCWNDLIEPIRTAWSEGHGAATMPNLYPIASMGKEKAEEQAEAWGKILSGKGVREATKGTKTPSVPAWVRLLHSSVSGAKKASLAAFLAELESRYLDSARRKQAPPWISDEKWEALAVEAKAKGAEDDKE